MAFGAVKGLCPWRGGGGGRAGRPSRHSGAGFCSSSVEMVLLQLGPWGCPSCPPPGVTDGWTCRALSSALCSSPRGTGEESRRPLPQRAKRLGCGERGAHLCVARPDLGPFSGWPSMCPGPQHAQPSAVLRTICPRGVLERGPHNRGADSQEFCKTVFKLGVT